MKDYNKKQVAQLITLIQLLVGDLSKGDRQKICTICTIDVHNRDVVAKLINMKAENAQEFAWLSQLKHRLISGGVVMSGVVMGGVVMSGVVMGGVVMGGVVMGVPW